MSTKTVLSLAATITPLPAKEEIVRRTAEYHPSIWGDYFISYTSKIDDEIMQEWVEAEVLKEKVRGMLTVNFGEKLLEEKLKLIDAIQRLGISYHFEGELKAALKQINNDYGNYPYDDVEDNLHITSLRFRLLRQYGYNVSCDIFNKLKDHDGTFKEGLTKMDLQVLLSLYEATHLRVHGETILDEALVFVRTHLQSMVFNLDPLLAKQVLHALYRPIRKSLIILEARDYISFYQEDNKLHNETLLNFARLDFNVLQKQHQKELSIITKWWKDLEFNKKLPFARDRLVECYFWILGVYYEPQYAIARKFTTQIISLTSVIDDIYDNYGIKYELELFTDAVNRWEMSAMDKLPEYMKILYQALLNVYDEMEEEMGKEGRAYVMCYAKEAMKRLVTAYYEESKWLGSEKIPTMEEYMKVALGTSAYSLIATASIVGMGEIATNDVFDWLHSEPPILKASCFICRIMDDMVGYEFEQQRGHVPSAVQCYMNQYQVSETQACANFQREVEDAWKDINQAFLEPQAISSKILTCILNMPRVIDLLYKEDDGYTNAGAKTKQYITRVLVDPVEI